MGCGCNKKRTQKISNSMKRQNNLNKNNTGNNSEKRKSDRKRRMVSIKAMSNSTFSKKD